MWGAGNGWGGAARRGGTTSASAKRTRRGRASGLPAAPLDGGCTMSYDTMSGGGSLPHELQSALDKWNAGGHAGGPSVEATAQRFSLYASQADPQQLQSLTSEALGHLPAAQ